MNLFEQQCMYVKKKKEGLNMIIVKISKEINVGSKHFEISTSGYKFYVENICFIWSVVSSKTNIL